MTTFRKMILEIFAWITPFCTLPNHSSHPSTRRKETRIWKNCTSRPWESRESICSKCSNV